MIEVFSFFNTPYLMAPPIGPQIGKAAKKVGQEFVEQLPKYGDDVVREVTKNPGFFESIPTWVWIVLGVIVIGVIVHLIDEHF